MANVIVRTSAAANGIVPVLQRELRALDPELVFLDRGTMRDLANVRLFAVRAGAWPVSPLFEFIAEKGRVGAEEMFRVFNMGVGMILFVRPENMVRVAKLFESSGQPFYAIGNVHEGRREVAIDFRAS